MAWVDLLRNGLGVDVAIEAVGVPARHHFGPNDFMEAYDVFEKAAETGAVKVVLTC